MLAGYTHGTRTKVLKQYGKAILRACVIVELVRGEALDDWFFQEGFSCLFYKRGQFVMKLL